MEIFIDKNDDLKSAKGGVYALGNFDGVPLGHKEIVSNVIKISRSKRIPSGVFILINVICFQKEKHQKKLN